LTPSGVKQFQVNSPRGKLRAVFFPVRVYRVNEGNYRTWMCIICGWVYDEEKGAPAEGIAPGTRWEDIPEFWVCPDCGASKSDFDLVEI